MDFEQFKCYGLASSIHACAISGFLVKRLVAEKPEDRRRSGTDPDDQPVTSGDKKIEITPFLFTFEEGVSKPHFSFTFSLLFYLHVGRDPCQISKK
jgi:hypothetical protein